MTKQLGVPATYQPRSWVQTDRRTHELWAALVLKHPRSAQLMHILCAHIGSHNAVVIGQKTLAQLMACTDRTVRNALVPLVAGRWIEVVQVGAAATVNAYVINSRVAWTESREQIGRLSAFSATVIADAEDQPPSTVDQSPLLRLPIIYPPEEAMPHGDGEPGAQISLPGMEPVIEGKPPIGASTVTAVVAPSPQPAHHAADPLLSHPAASAPSPASPAPAPAPQTRSHRSMPASVAAARPWPHRCRRSRLRDE